MGASEKQCKHLGRAFFRPIILIEDYRKERDRVFAKMGHMYRECNGPEGMQCEHIFKTDETKPTSEPIIICKKETTLVSRVNNL